MIILYILGALIVAASVYVAVAYNLLVAAKNTVNAAWSDVEVQVKRRYDLVPNLVSAVKAYAEHESSVIENAVKARTAAMSAQGGADERYYAEKNLSTALKSLIAVSEKYPELKASENFLKLQFELTDIEDRIKASRRFYNTNVMDFNTRMEQFPCNIIAKHFSFKQADFFELPHKEAAAANKPAEVKF